MAGPTKQQIEEYIKNNNLDVDVDESYPRSDWWKFRNQRDMYKRQRDELINDMAEVKRKAEAFDEIKHEYSKKDDEPSEEIFMNMGYIINNLEDHYER